MRFAGVAVYCGLPADFCAHASGAGAAALNCWPMADCIAIKGIFIAMKERIYRDEGHRSGARTRRSRRIIAIKGTRHETQGPPGTCTGQDAAPGWFPP
jgi:hypothetical protein